MTPDPLKAKPETLGFGREAEEIYIPWNTDDDQYRWVCRKAIAAALEAAFSKGIEEQEKRCGTHCVPVGEKAFSDGWNACREASAKVAEHYSDCSCHCGEWLSDEIRALKPAKGERT